MRRSCPLIALTVLLAACGGQTRAGPVPQKAAPDPAQALRALIDAAHDGNDRAVGALVAPGRKARALELGELGTFAGARPQTLYRSGVWAVAYVMSNRSGEGTRKRGAYAVALHLLGGRWRADLTGRVGVEILGPQPGTRTGVRPQLGVELRARTPLGESGLWLDGRELLEKGGGSLTRGSIYGAPDHRVSPGVHVAVAYARAGAHASAIAWVFRV